MPVDIFSLLAPISDLFQPSILAAAENPNVNYSAVRFGKYWRSGNLCRVSYNIVTNSISKTNLAEAMRLSLPFPADDGANNVQDGTGLFASNALLAKTANGYSINPGDSFLTLKSQTLNSLITDLTFGILTGIGVLSSPITIRGSLTYEVK